MFVVAMSFISCNVWSVNPLKCVSMSNPECKVRPEIITSWTFVLSLQYFANKCSDSCNNISNPFAKLYVPDVVKNKC